MLTSKKLSVVIYLVLLVVALGLLFGCDGKKTPTPSHMPTEIPIEETPTPSPDVTPTPSQYPSVHALEDYEFYPNFSALCPVEPEYIDSLDTDPDNEDRAYIQGQVIITGNLQVIEDTIADVFLFTLWDMEPLILQLDDDNVIARVKTSELSLTPELDLASELEFIRRFNIIVLGSEDPPKPRDAIAGPNYVIREPGGSLGTTGFPGDSSIIGDPVTLPSGVVGVTVDNFVDQWAFDRIANGIEFGPAFYESWDPNVKILVFDSSPLATGSYEVRLGPNYPSYPLCVSALINDMSGIEMTSDAWEVDSHGLFAANLAHTVAPASFIHLVQVLQYDAGAKEGEIIRGDLFWLLNALYLYLEHDRTNLSTVVNLSLGFDINEKNFKDISENFCQDIIDPEGFLIDDEVSPSQELGCTIETVRKVLRARGDPILLGIEKNPDIDANEYLPMASLQALLSHYYHERGVVFVAAAGNDKGNLPQTPAIYPWVIGVGASNHAGAASCFSNGSDVSAPGGDGESWDECVIDLKNCKNDPDCSRGVMSIVMTDPVVSSYAYWVGTSFSTPLVSGMAALALVEGYASLDVQSLFCPDQNQIDEILKYNHARGQFICGPATLADVVVP
jgi:hypothetical protein